MAAAALGIVIGAFLLGRIAAPPARIMMTGWLAVLSCAPLIGSAWSPPLLGRAGALDAGGRGWRLPASGGRGVLQALRPATSARAFGVAQSGLYAVQGSAILVGGAAAQAIGAPLAVGLPVWWV